MADIDFEELTRYARSFTGLTPEREALLVEIGPAIRPLLPEVTEAFYADLAKVPKAAAFIEGRVEGLKATHLGWLESVFTGPFDAAYAARMYHVGDVHVKVQMPVEFMAASMTLVGNTLLTTVARVCGGDHDRCIKTNAAVSAVLGFCLMIMQESYQSSSLAEELDRFLAITGMSRALFDNLAGAYRA